jgi:DNA mismatch repair protein MutS
VEMLEAKNAITNATQQSLILFDEIGRGTSTYDGMALAQAIIEYIHEHIGAKTLFSTHYHELTTLADDLPKLKNIHVSAVEQNGHVVFLHKIKEGAADKSYGIHVAKLANLPESLIDRANEILMKLENSHPEENESQVEPELIFENELILTKSETDASRKNTQLTQLSFFEDQSSETKTATSKEKKVLSELKTADILEMTPIDALNLLYTLQKKLK